MLVRTRGMTKHQRETEQGDCGDVFRYYISGTQKEATREVS